VGDRKMDTQIKTINLSTSSLFGRKASYLWLLLLVLFVFPIGLGSESVEITTYYPSPYGSYDTLRVSNYVAVARRFDGELFKATKIDTNIDPDAYGFQATSDNGGLVLAPASTLKFHPGDAGILVENNRFDGGDAFIGGLCKLYANTSPPSSTYWTKIANAIYFVNYDGPQYIINLNPHYVSNSDPDTNPQNVLNYVDFPEDYSIWCRIDPNNPAT
jgi:hypothetical protein